MWKLLCYIQWKFAINDITLDTKKNNIKKVRIWSLVTFEPWNEKRPEWKNLFQNCMGNLMEMKTVFGKLRILIQFKMKNLKSYFTRENIEYNNI